MQTAAVTSDVNTIDVKPIAPPEATGSEALLAVEAVGICGTDLHIFDGSFPASLPLVQGHEISALVEYLPQGYTGELRVGGRVAVQPVIGCGSCYPCRIGRSNTCAAMTAVGLHRAGGFQEKVAVPVANLHAADGLPPAVVALCETLSVGRRAVTRSHVTSDDTVLVLGAGPIGLAAVLAAHDLGARVMSLDLQESRLRLARSLGATETVADLSRLSECALVWTDGDGPSVVIDATGAPAVVEAAFDVVAAAGRISIAGVSERHVDLSIRAFTAKELDVYGSRSTLDFPGAIALARRHQELAALLVSHRFGLEEAGQALAFAHDNPQDVIKAIVEVQPHSGT